MAVEQPASWRLTWDGRTWTDADLTGSDLVELVALLGNDWRHMTPTAGPLHLVSFLAVLVQRATGDDFPKVLGQLKMANAGDLADALTLE